MKELIVLSPFYLPAPGGAGRYYSLLIEELSSVNQFSNIKLYTEKYPEQKKHQPIGENSSVARVFPFRAGSNDTSRYKYIKYIIQNVQILLLFFRLIRGDKVFLIHGYFFNNISSVGILVRLLRLNFFRKFKVIADLRDPKLGEKNIKRLHCVDQIIFCSKNIEEHLKENGWKKDNLNYIPVPFQARIPEKNNVSRILDGLGLTGKKFVFTPNGISNEKGIVEILNLTKVLISHGKADVLVVAGKKRDWDSRMEQAEKEGALIYIGNLKHEDVLCLISAACLVPLISSSIEGMPRTALEAISLKTPVLLPKNVSEFKQFHDVCISTEDELSDIGHKALNVIDGNAKYPSYDMSEHDWPLLRDKYLSLLN